MPSAYASRGFFLPQPEIQRLFAAKELQVSLASLPSPVAATAYPSRYDYGTLHSHPQYARSLSLSISRTLGSCRRVLDLENEVAVAKSWKLSPELGAVRLSLIWRELFDVVEHQGCNRCFLRFQFQAQLV